MHFFLYGGILSSTWWFLDHGVAILPNLSFKKIAMRPPLNKKDFSFYAYHPTLQTNDHSALQNRPSSDGVKCNDSPIITLQRLLTTTYSMLHYKHNQRSWMPIISPQQVAYLHSLVKYKSYSVHHKYHSPAHIKFKTYAEAKAYCIKHNLDHTSSWVLTTVNHCA